MPASELKFLSHIISDLEVSDIELRKREEERRAAREKRNQLIWNGQRILSVISSPERFNTDELIGCKVAFGGDSPRDLRRMVSPYVDTDLELPLGKVEIRVAELFVPHGRFFEKVDGIEIHARIPDNPFIKRRTLYAIGHERMLNYLAQETTNERDFRHAEDLLEYIRIKLNERVGLIRA